MVLHERVLPPPILGRCLFPECGEGIRLLFSAPLAPPQDGFVHSKHGDCVGHDTQEVGGHAAVEGSEALLGEDELERLDQRAVLGRLVRGRRLPQACADDLGKRGNVSSVTTDEPKGIVGGCLLHGGR